MRTGRLAGHYFNVLGMGSFTWMVIGPILGHPLFIDFSFILYFWMGFGLLNRRKGFRTGALILLSLVTLFCVGYLISLIWATGPVSSKGELRTPLLASAHAAILVLIFLPPLVLLLLPGTRRWFTESAEPPPTRFALTGRLIGIYLLVSLVFDAGAEVIHRATGTVEPQGWSTSIRYGENKIGTAAAGWMEDKSTGRRLYVSWLAFGESNSTGRGEGYVSFGGHRVDVADSKPVRYLGVPPEGTVSSGNVFLVRQDGTVIRLPRRVTPDQLEDARKAVDGSKDFDEVHRRLEAMLPAAEVAAR